MEVRILSDGGVQVLKYRPHQSKRPKRGRYASRYTVAEQKLAAMQDYERCINMWAGLATTDRNSTHVLYYDWEQAVYVVISIKKPMLTPAKWIAVACFNMFGYRSGRSCEHITTLGDLIDEIEDANITGGSHNSYPDDIARLAARHLLYAEPSIMEPESGRTTAALVELT
ncbi:hypothetical protein CENSYa_0243 [Cenarchaeum symbiosum A]|uniref:Uncharacterized protein n=1 Tax=Cenarchaeum symbiosum (strain A) TaxID=414004 RepID=A0RU68_CENSY|nr:hypothetical protein CENSYa_0243 [Cenarchaeum symbiosum A]